MDAENKAKILVVDDDHNLLKVIAYQLTEAGYEVASSSSAKKALSLLAKDKVDLLLTDLKMPEMDGMELLDKVRKAHPDLPVIFITAFAAIDSAVEAIKAGATDYLPKPFAKDDLFNKVRRALNEESLKEENARLKRTLAQKEGLDEIVGHSPAMRNIYDLVAQVAGSDSTVLIQGESGAGKELLARAVHRMSTRAGGPFVAINCAAIPRELLESELFGHVRGAFTGAIRDRIGVFQQAHTGTLFLDEVADISLELQPKLLRVLQEREVTRVGANNAERVDVRIVAATKTNLKAMVDGGQFREDLFYRLNVVPVTLPPLRERGGDIELLAVNFLKIHNPKWSGKISAEVLGRLRAYHWPGNVRELENLMERLSVIHGGKELDVGMLPVEFQESQPEKVESSEHDKLAAAEKGLIVDALRESGGNQSQAAKMLGIPRHILLYRIKKYNINDAE